MGGVRVNSSIPKSACRSERVVPGRHAVPGHHAWVEQTSESRVAEPSAAGGVRPRLGAAPMSGGYFEADGVLIVALSAAVRQANQARPGFGVGRPFVDLREGGDRSGQVALVGAGGAHGEVMAGHPGACGVAVAIGPSLLDVLVGWARDRDHRGEGQDEAQGGHPEGAAAPSGGGADRCADGHLGKDEEGGRPSGSELVERNGCAGTV